MLEPSEVIDLFFNHLSPTTIESGSIIFERGEKGNKMFALIEGEVELHLEGKLVETIANHDIFGEGALIQPQHDRFTTAIAKTKCQLVELDKEKFLFLVQETPLFALEVIRSLSSRLRKIKTQCEP